MKMDTMLLTASILSSMLMEFIIPTTQAMVIKSLSIGDSKRLILVPVVTNTQRFNNHGLGRRDNELHQHARQYGRN